MRFLMISMLITLATALTAAAPGTWPPLWVSDTNGGATGTADDHTGLDYGQDSYGYWANLDIEDAGGAALATIEMRYIEPDSFTMGAYPNEEGARPYELPRVTVNDTDINGNQPFWISAIECTQQVWEEMKKINDVNFEMKLKQWDNSDIADDDTAAFPIDTDGFGEPCNPSGYPLDHDNQLGDWRTAVDGNFRATFDADKAIRAIESQTFQNCKDFCENDLTTQIRSQSGSGTLNVRLPSEKEWEYVCRAGSQGPFYTGAILPDFQFSLTNLVYNKTDFLFDFDTNHIDANIHSAPGGDGGENPEWHAEVGSIINIVGITLDGVGNPGGDGGLATDGITVPIGGRVTISGDLEAEDIVANFDMRYHRHWTPNLYGSHTPILMTYRLVNSMYIPEPYASPAADVFYRYLNTDTYVLSTSVNNGNTSINETFRLYDDILVPPAAGVTGDYFTAGRLEPFAMLRVNTRFTSGGTESSTGTHIKDYAGNVHGISTLYTPAAYRNGAVYIGSTFPDSDRGAQTNEEIVRNIDLSDNPGEEMSVEDYIRVYKEKIDEHIGGRNYDASFYSGNKNYTVTYTETEFDVNGNPVQVTKTASVTLDTISIGDALHLTYDENIQIDDTIGGSDVYVTPDKQLRNAFGLINTHGNVAEWVDTTWNGMSDHSNHVNGSYQITRGGSWRNGAEYCRSSSRVARDPARAYDDVGFRFILTD